MPLDDEDKWFRYHHLFAEVLQSRLHQVHPEWVPELYWRAREWFEGKGFNPEAIEYALRGHHWVHAIPLIEANMQEAKKRGEMATVLRWLGALPNEAIHTRPMLGLTHAWLLVEVDEFSLAERRLAATEQAFRSDPTRDADEQAALLGQVALVRETSALMQEYPGEVTIAAGREALALLPESDLARRAYALLILGCAQYISLGDMQTAERSFEEAIRLSQSAGDAFTELMIRSHVIGMRVIQGRLRAAEMSSDELLTLASQPGWEHLPAAGLTRVWGSPVLYERNNLAGALEALTQGIAEVEGYSLKRPAIIGCIRLARLTLALGEWDKARELMERTWETIQKHHLKQIMIPAAAYRARLFLQINEFETAMQWATTIELSTDNPLNPALEYEYITLARVQLASGRVEECQQLLARLQPPAETAGRMSRAIEILALKSVVALAQHNEDEALATLNRALVLAEPEGFIRSFIDEGEPMRLLLFDYQSSIKKKIIDSVDSESLRLLTYTDKLLAAFPKTASIEKPKQEALPEPLSERELDILRLIATGRSNKEIAEILVIAVSTVKSHINNLYGKLGTQRRTQAISIARDLGLLEERNA
jgi:LuxR family maltose regulon positive regulatory protein